MPRKVAYLYQPTYCRYISRGSITERKLNMLKLTDIHKAYKTADFTQHALDGVTVTFRDNEFAAVLGPSGSGKTTMLNIIGGLDHYDSGDLEIDGISTRKYKDKDWDTYRNNRIGFVFQSYNLIPHQSVLANVELALTLSGVNAVERKKRAVQALEEVGLGEHINKHPNQLSGGQMQRVAIARALINDPEILLADEPTGALDTQTGTQVMDLLTRIAKTRLVIMVTHNDALARQYATRTIHLKDGQITSDSRPFDPSTEKQRTGRAPRKASMSFFTAVALSFSNLMTKKTRTFITSLAGSIGIIGIAAILALATGINAYIQNVEQETMSIYPLTIQNAGFDLTELFSGPGGQAEGDENEDAGDVRVRKLVETLFSHQSQNDLAALKNYLEANAEAVGPLVTAVQYTYDITPQIYLADTTDGVQQVHPDSIMGNIGMNASSSFSSLAGSFGMGGMKAFHELPGDVSMFEYQYEVVAGHWPQNYDETVLVLSSRGAISDFVLYGMGLYDRAELQAFVDLFMNGTQTELEIGDGEAGALSYESLMAARFKVVIPADRYQYDSRYDVWVNKSDDKAYMTSLVDEGLPLKVVGIVQPLPDVTATSLSDGINYTPQLVDYLMDAAAQRQVVQDQLARPRVNVLTGRTFAEEKAELDSSAFDFADVISIDEEIAQSAFIFDTSAISLNFSNLGLGLAGLDLSGLNMSGLDLSGMALPPLDLSGIDLAGFDRSAIQTPDFDIDGLTQALAAQVNVPADALTEMITGVLQGFIADSIAGGADFADPATDIPGLLNAYLAREDVQQAISAQLAGLVDPTQLQEQVNAAIQDYAQVAMDAYMQQMSTALGAYLQTAMQGVLETYMAQAMAALMPQFQALLAAQIETQLVPLLQTQIEGAMQSAIQQLPGQIKNAISIDEDVFADAFQLNMGQDELLDLMTTLMSAEESTSARNLSQLGYADPAVPSQISIYPLDFDSKAGVQAVLERYNAQMEAGGEPDKMIRYTDIVGVMMASVTDIVNMISYALIAFVAISLVVSSIMIGVITYVSVLERKKEIGILRAIGASKRDIRRVFNAEALIVGFVAGLLGILLTILICIPANIIVANRLGIEQIAQLPVAAGAVLIGISMLLAFVAGLFPSSAAARRDPVEALRSE